ncbi:MAG: hypothetical protein C0600_06330 [Ignavibacteria bacterium]|nr:MAG: hypothetical protein C0600_06330 [Ignavibacteria bacterium]
MNICIVEASAHLPGHFSLELAAFLRVLSRHAGVRLLTPFGMHDPPPPDLASLVENLLDRTSLRDDTGTLYEHQMAFYRRVRAQIRASAPDVAHIYGYQSVFPLWRYLRYSSTGIPTILNLKNLQRPQLDTRIPSSLRPLRSALSRALLTRLANGYLMHSQEIRQEAITAGIDEKAVHQLMFGIDIPEDSVDRSAARSRLDLPEQKRILLFFGVIRPEKGLQHILPKLESLPDDFLLLVAGPDADRQIREMGQGVLLHSPKLLVHDGYVTSENMATYFCAADAVVVAHDPIFSGVSGVLMDAVRYLRPILGTTRGYTGQYVEKELLGATFTLESEEDFVRSANRVTDKDWLRKQEITRHLQSFRGRYTWEQLIPEYLRVYEQVISQARSTR